MQELKKPSIELPELLKRLADDEAQANRMGITVDKLRAMQEYAFVLRQKNPGMRPKRLQRKVAEHFKVKLT